MIVQSNVMNINLHIEHLILDDLGFQSHKKNELKAAVEAELKRQIARHGVGYRMQSNINLHSIRGVSISIENSSKPASLGHQIGNAVYRSIRK